MRILNVGCGSDTYGTHFIDLYPTRREVIRCDIDVDRFPFEDGFFDKVYSKCVLEHLTNPRNFFAESRRVLKKGGILEVVTDNANYIKFVYLPVHHGGYDGKFGEEDRHYALFTTTHLKNFLRKFGFRVLECGYEGWNGERFPESDTRSVELYRRVKYPRLYIIGEKL